VKSLVKRPVQGIGRPLALQNVQFRTEQLELTPLISEACLQLLASRFDLGRRSKGHLPIVQHLADEREQFVASNLANCFFAIFVRAAAEGADRYREGTKTYEVVPVRFVRACEHGHVDDIDWPAFIHGYPPARRFT
jgi:hypothetical protein